MEPTGLLPGDCVLAGATSPSAARRGGSVAVCCRRHPTPPHTQPPQGRTAHKWHRLWLGAKSKRRMREETSLIIPAVRAVLDEALAAGRRTTDSGKAIDEHQVHAERLAYAATEAAAAEALAAYARGRRDRRPDGGRVCGRGGEPARRRDRGPARRLRRLRRDARVHAWRSRGPRRRARCTARGAAPRDRSGD